MTRGNDVFLRLAQWVLVGLALLSLLGGAAAALGVSGSSSLYDRHVPRVVAEVAQRVWPGSGEMPSALVKVREEHRTDTYEAFNQISREGGRVPKGWAELPAAPTVGSAGQLTFWDPGILRRTAWLIVISLTPIGLAWLWWTLSKIVASAREGDPFNERNARRLGVAGGLVVLGPALVILGRQLVLKWMLANSTAAGKADLWFRWGTLPLWTLGVGLALIVLAGVWRRGVAMRQDLEGLV